MEKNWTLFYEQESKQSYFLKLSAFLKKEYENYVVFPPKPYVFNALKFTPYNQVSVVILGQDPYHNEHQAMGLSFSVAPNIPLPQSLKNIFKEVSDDLGVEMGNSGNLIPWAKQGVLLMNTILTVRKNQPLSHKNQGWEEWSNHLISYLNTHTTPIVFLLWGRNAQNYAPLITNPIHLILKAAHPSPLSAHQGFFGCKHFSKTNAFLKKHQIPEIDWCIKDD